MKVTSLTELEIMAIGEAFADHPCPADDQGLARLFRGGRASGITAAMSGRHCPAVLETDARHKRDKYVSVGMTCVRERRCAEDTALVDMVKEFD